MMFTVRERGRTFVHFIVAIALLFPGVGRAADEELERNEKYLRKAGIEPTTKAVGDYLRSCAESEKKQWQAPRLIRQLGSDEFAMREKASAELVSMGAAVLTVLAEAAKNDDPEIATRAAKCIEKIGQNPRRIESNSSCRSAALKVLLHRGGPGIETAFVVALQSPDRDVQSGGAEIIRKVMDDRRGIEIGHRSWSQEAMVLRPKLGPIMAALFAAASSPDADVRQPAIAALDWLGRSELPGIAKAIRTAPDFDAKRTAIAKLYKINYQFLSQEVAPVLLEGLKDRDAKVREEVIGTLHVLLPAADQVVPALVAALDDSQAAVRIKAAYALGNFGPQGNPAIPDLLRHLGSADPDLRRAAALSLGKISVPPADPAVLRALIEALQDKNVTAREGAIWALSYIGPEAKDAVPALIAIVESPYFRNDKIDSFQRSAPLFALCNIGPEAKAAVPILLKVAQDKSGQKWLRRLSVLALGEIGPAAEPAVQFLVELLRAGEEEPSPSDAARALRGIGPRAAKAAAPTLLEIAKNANEKGAVRHAAFEALQTLDPAAAAAIRKQFVVDDLDGKTKPDR